MINKKIFCLLGLIFFSQASCTETLENITQEKALRVKAILNFNLSLTAREFEKSMIPLLAKHNITFVERNPDLILICGSPTEDMLTLCKPHILLDESESASISRTIRRSLKSPYTIAIFKNTVLRQKSLYNEGIRYHFNLLLGYTFKKNTALPTLSPYEREKIRAVLWDTYRSPFNNSENNNLTPLKNLAIDFHANKETARPIDVFFSGTVNDKTPPGVHREKLMEALELIQQAHPHKKIISHKGRLPKEEYLHLLRTSKIAVSPWGNGEWCWRDYEAMYSGALVIKPNTDFVHMVPDLYRNNKYYIACKPDFSDLGEKISYALENYEYLRTLRKDARNLLVNHWDHEKIAYDLAQAIKDAFKQHRLSLKNTRTR